MVKKTRMLLSLGLLARVLLSASQLAAEVGPDRQAGGTNATIKVTKYEDAKALKKWLTLVVSNSPEDRQRALELTAHPRVVTIGPGFRTPDRVAFQREAKPLVGKLTDLLKHPNEQVEREALDWLSAIGPEAQACVPALKAQILMPNAATRFSAIETMLHVVPEDTPVGPVILDFLSSYLKSLTPQELSEFDIHLKTEMQTDGTTVKRLSGPRSFGLGISVAGYAIILASSGHTLCEVPYLLKAASPDYPNYIRAVALGILAELREESKAAIPRLRELLHDTDPVVRYFSANALLFVSRKPAIITELADQLGLQGQERVRFEKSAQQRLADSSENWGSAEALEAWHDPLFQQIILGQIEYGNGFYRRQGLRFLRQIGTGTEQVRPLLRRLLNHKDAETRDLADDILQRIAATGDSEACAAPPFRQRPDPHGRAHVGCWPDRAARTVGQAPGVDIGACIRRKGQTH